MKQSIIVVLLLLTAMIEVADAEWLYSKVTDPFDDSVTHDIYTESVDGDLGWLHVRRKGSMLEIFVFTRFVTNNFGMTPVEWRFDKRESKSCYWMPSTDMKGAFLNDKYDKGYKPIFLQNMKECNTLVIGFPLGDGGLVTMRFSLVGFTAMYNKYIG